MKKIVKISKAQSGKAIAKSIKLDTPSTKSDSVRAEEMARYKQLRALSKTGSTATKESAFIDATKSQYKKARSIASNKNGGKIVKRKK